MKYLPIEEYYKIRPKLKTGDIILFRGKGLASALILWFCSIWNWFKKTKFSHIGVIVRSATGRVMLLESTTLILNDAHNINLKKKGVRLVPLSKLLELYPGQMFVRQLHTERTYKMLIDADKFIAANIGKPYERDPIELMGSAIDNIDWYKGQNKDDFFCSELVAEFYKMWDLLPQNIPANEYIPDDFAAGNKVDVLVQTMPPVAELDEEVRIK